ncbi:HAD family hydrolase [Olsenella profusa]|uniref:Haloacid dehalogenase-like hydrolase n=1 Tax=Olsenella profusa TaxID=138595 RepID=A0ABS2F497_9ACTN|nr:HAD family hydrolase [Olsenella profusa]MBM6775377.1 haloacid dehalogenase-like hydrolase [Olsenella profusa]
MQPTPERDIRPVAVFDFDGTSIRGQSGALVTRYLFMHGYMSLARLGRLTWWGIRYKLHLPYRQSEARELVFGALAGRSAAEVDAILTRFHNEVLLPRYRPQALEEVRRCHDQGLTVIIVSATFEPIAAIAAERMGADGYAATRMARDPQGRYTGKVEGPVVAGEEKYHAAERWCNGHLGTGRWRLERAYGDHHTDAYLLSRAKHACAVCPGTTLEVSARRHGWEILDWDK